MTALRRCLACDATTPILPDEATWPLSAACAHCGVAVAEHDGIATFAPELADTVSGMDPAAFESLSKIEADHFWFVARNELLVGLARKLFPGARSYLKIGCGNGAVLNAMRVSRSWDRIVGSELHPSGLVHARQRMPSGVEFVQMDARNIPVSEAFDLTGAFDVIEHIPEDEAVLRGLRRATARGGGIMIAVPQHPWLWSVADDAAFHQRRYKRGELENKLERNGFNVIFSSSYTAALLPLMAVSRLTDKRTVANFDLAREFIIDPRINASLKAILRLEVKATLAGLRWPAGGSRVVAARAI